MEGQQINEGCRATEPKTQRFGLKKLHRMFMKVTVLISETDEASVQFIGSQPKKKASGEKPAVSRSDVFYRGWQQKPLQHVNTPRCTLSENTRPDAVRRPERQPFVFQEANSRRWSHNECLLTSCIHISNSSNSSLKYIKTNVKITSVGLGGKSD